MTLSGDEVRNLVVDNKWIQTLRDEIEGEVYKTSRNLNQRVKELADRYASPLPGLEKEIEFLSSKARQHLKKMGFQWS